MVHRPQSTEARRVEELLARSAVYRALSVLLRHPDATTAKWLLAREHHRLTEVLGRLGVDGRLSARAQHLLKVLDAATLADVARQHEQTFGHTVQSAAPPYELEYGEEHSHRQPQELSDIAAFYTAFGLAMAASAHERVDHVATECEFLHYLLYKHACAVDADAHEQAEVCRNAIQRFLAEHLGRWGPAFALRLSRTASHEWLGMAGDMLLEWLSQECARMSVPLGSRDLPLRSPKEQEASGCAACVLQQGNANDGPTP